MNVKVEPQGIRELEAELKHYEGEFGTPSPVFAHAYARGKAPEILEETALEWVMAYAAWCLVTESTADPPSLQQ